MELLKMDKKIKGKEKMKRNKKWKWGAKERRTKKKMCIAKTTLIV